MTDDEMNDGHINVTKAFLRDYQNVTNSIIFSGLD
jgi:hypothetical protein